MRRLVLWRHGRTAWNAEHRFQGQTDVPLDDVGIRQARTAAAILAALGPDAIVTSDLQRAADTAAALADLTGITPLQDPDLRETYAGTWQGLTRPELLERHGDELRAWAAGDDLRPGGGERRSEVADRMVGAITRHLPLIGDDGTLVVVTHGGSARAAIGRLLGLPVADWAILGVLSNTSWSVLLENESGRPWRLQEYNAGSLPEPVPTDGVWPADDR